MSAFDDNTDLEPPAWEPEPLELPIEAPCIPELDRSGDTDDSERSVGVIIIDLC